MGLCVTLARVVVDVLEGASRGGFFALGERGSLGRSKLAKAPRREWLSEARWEGAEA